MRTLTLALILTALAGTARADTTVEDRRPAAPDGLVEIENPTGSTHVIGWNKPEVAVSGTLRRRASGLEFTGDTHRTRISVEASGSHHGAGGDLEIYVPAGSRLGIESFAGSITITDVTGPVKAETVNGSISMTGGSKEVNLQTVNGSVEVTSPATHLHAESVNGAVTVKDASGEVDASTVNGQLVVVGGTFTRARLETVSGGLRFEGDLARKATLEAETVSGSVELSLPAATSADFSVTTFSGDIANEFGPAAQKTSRYTSEKSLTFSTGGGGAKVSVQTLSGAIRLHKR